MKRRRCAHEQGGRPGGVAIAAEALGKSEAEPVLAAPGVGERGLDQRGRLGRAAAGEEEKGALLGQIGREQGRSGLGRAQDGIAVAMRGALGPGAQQRLDEGAVGVAASDKAEGRVGAVAAERIGDQQQPRRERSARRGQRKRGDDGTIEVARLDPGFDRPAADRDVAAVGVEQGREQ